MAEENKHGWALWMSENWRSISFVIYCIICLFDFLIMPSLFQAFNQHLSAKDIVDLAQTFKDTQVQLSVINTFGARIVWTPLTLQGGGMFHISFGAILTAAGFTRGQAEIEKIKNNVQQTTNQ